MANDVSHIYIEDIGRLDVKDPTKMLINMKGAAGGVAELDSNGKVPTYQLPNYVEEVIEGYYYNGKFYQNSAHTVEIQGAPGFIYIDKGTTPNKTYRWIGDHFVEVKIGNFTWGDLCRRT